MLQPASASAWLPALPALLVLARLGALVCGQDACAYVHSGSQMGVPYHLAVTYLFPGVADWNIIVPRPPECARGYVAGHETRVCDHDAAPRLRVTPQGALVERSGWLRGVAAVYCTVFCVFPPRLQSRLPELPQLPAVPSRSKHVTTEPAAATTSAKAVLSSAEHPSESKSTIVAMLSSTSSSSSEEDESVEESD
ncbi:unnamed protein product [Spodoptera littoralis]|uniref:Uncharacterized protein n=1 Tax=Spodoptera littoralis TaxID=7109 RepID=A0A9P0IHL5_SPOLI|nr:unnamed protein product [Spodoptera littoralis]CAH1645241.1 unnamed protein product [Spodoptera littoralis]